VEVSEELARVDIIPEVIVPPERAGNRDVQLFVSGHGEDATTI
jgi:hypothetical protein